MWGVAGSLSGVRERAEPDQLHQLPVQGALQDQPAKDGVRQFPALDPPGDAWVGAAGPSPALQRGDSAGRPDRRGAAGRGDRGHGRVRAQPAGRGPQHQRLPCVWHSHRGEWHPESERHCE